MTKIELTDNYVRNLPLSDVGQYQVRDVRVPGFFVVVGKRAKTFTVQVDVTDPLSRRTRTKKKAVGKFPETRVSDEGLVDLFEDVGADENCTDIARLARLPGTTNWGSLKGNGRTDRLASALYDPGSEKNNRPKGYTLKDFDKVRRSAPPQTVASTSLNSPLATSDSGSVGTRRTCPVPVLVTALSDLGFETDDAGCSDDPLAVAIVHGDNKVREFAPEDVRRRWLKNPDGPIHGEVDRSRIVFHIAAELDRREIAPEIIAGSLLNPDWGISAHLFDRHKGASQVQIEKRATYAQRQVDRAMADNDAKKAAELDGPVPPEDFDDAIRWMNARHAVVNNFGGKFRIMTLRPGDQVPLFQSDADWGKRYLPYRVAEASEEGNVKLAGAADSWLRNPRRRAYERVDFLPGEEAPPTDVFNLWRGWNLKNAPTTCDRYLELVLPKRECVFGVWRRAASFGRPVLRQNNLPDREVFRRLKNREFIHACYGSGKRDLPGFNYPTLLAHLADQVGKIGNAV